MPPKKARGGARGGRGRGGSAGPAAPPSAEELDQSSEIQMPGSGSAANRLEPVTTPDKTANEGDRMDLDPNDSPATQPTETPASTPLRPPSSLQMQPADSSGGAPSRGGTRGRAKESKFKPKNVRRSASELKALADQESERVAAAAAAAAKLRGRGNAFRARAGRGRGDAMGRGRGAMSSVASGPFAVAPEIGKRGGFGVLGVSGVSGASGVAGVKRESGPNPAQSTGSGLNIKSENTSGGRSTYNGTGNRSFVPDPEYPDEDKNIPRVDIQHISLISSDEDDDDDILPSGSRYKAKANAARSNKGGLKPVRLDRHEHKERISQVNTGPPIVEGAAEGRLDSDMPVVDEQRSTGIGRRELKKVFKGAYMDEDEGTPVKDEPSEAMDGIDQLAPAAESNLISGELDTDEETTDDDEPAPKGRRKASAKRKQTKFVIQTEEDRREWERHLEDLEVLKEELGGMQQPASGTGKGKEREGDDPEKPVDKKEGRLYLFQFPPVMPKLYNPRKEVKPDPDTANPDEPAGDDDVQVTSSIDKTTIDLEQGVKTEGEETIIKEGDEPTQKKKRETLAEEEGYVGKLIVRESGRVELDWGGSRMLVGRGIPTSFLSMGVLVDSKGCYDKDGKSTGEGVATGMGKIMGKFVVTPDWESMVEDIERAEKRERRKQDN